MVWTRSLSLSLCVLRLWALGGGILLVLGGGGNQSGNDELAAPRDQAIRKSIYLRGAGSLGKGWCRARSAWIQSFNVTASNIGALLGFDARGRAHSASSGSSVITTNGRARGHVHRGPLSMGSNFTWPNALFWA
ncbi:hypothetical protein V8E36_001805 [Tilletia maclaganii]